MNHDLRCLCSRGTAVRLKRPGQADNVLKLDWGTSLGTGGVDAVYFLQWAVPVNGLISGYRVDEL